MTKTYNILVDLDALLDTRLAIAIELDSAAIEPTLAKDAPVSWWHRTHDHFDHPSSPIRIDGYRDRWLARTADDLPKSLMSNMLYYLREHTLEILDGQFGRTGLDVVQYAKSRVDINTWPYHVDPKDQQRLCDVVRRSLAIGSEVRCVHRAPNTLTPSYLDQTYKDYILYDFSTWIHHWETEMVRAQLPISTTILAPALLHDNTLDTNEEIDKEIEALGFDKQMALKLALSGFIQYEPLPVMLYSAFHQGYMEVFNHEMAELRKELRDRRMNDHA